MSATTVCEPTAVAHVVPLRVASRLHPGEGLQPVSFGVPWPKGVLTSATMAYLASPSGAADVQTQILSRWPDRSIKWLLCDALVGEDVLRGEQIELQVCCNQLRSASAAMNVMGHGVAVTVNTGTHCLTVDSESKSTVATLQDLSSQQALEISLPLCIDKPGESIRWEAPAVQTCGNIRTSITMCGVVERCRHLRIELRLSCYAGTGLLKCDVTLHNTRAAKHPGGLWDLGDQGSQLFSDFSLLVSSTQPWTTASLRTSADRAPMRMSSPFELSLVQFSSGGENWQCATHVDRHGKVPLHVRGFRQKSNGEATSGLRAIPSLLLSASQQSLAVAVPEYWQTFPKAITIDERSLRVGLFPAEHGAPHELQGGERKRHTVWLSLSSEHASSTLDWVHEPAVISASSQWHTASHTWPWLVDDETEVSAAAECVLTAAVDGGDSLIEKRETIDEFGWRNFGDVWADHEQDHYTGKGPVVSHYNNQFDLLYGALAHWLRTGNQNWWRIADPLARHVVDIDIYHTQQDRSAFSGGLFWHTDHYVSAGTATHRTYSRSNGEANYGGGPSNEHNYATGLAHYYYLSGDPSAREAVVTLANWIIAADDGRRSR